MPDLQAIFKEAWSNARIPTRDDIEGLQKRLDAISERVDALSRERGVQD